MLGHTRTHTQPHAHTQARVLTHSTSQWYKSKTQTFGTSDLQKQDICALLQLTSWRTSRGRGQPSQNSPMVIPPIRKQNKAYFSKLSQTMTCRVEADNLSLILMSLQEIVWVFRNFFGAHSLSHVWLFATPWTVARQAPLSMRFSRQEYWSGWPFPLPDLFGSRFQWCMRNDVNEQLRDKTREVEYLQPPPLLRLKFLRGYSQTPIAKFRSHLLVHILPSIWEVLGIVAY